MKFISATIFAVLATKVMASPDSADLPASGGKSRKLSAKSGDKCAGDDAVQKAALILDLLMRQAYVSIAPLRATGLFDGEPGNSDSEWAFFRKVLGNKYVEALLAYDREEGDGDGDMSRKEWVLFYLEEYYSDTCIAELNAMRNELPEVPKELLIPNFAAPQDTGS